MLKQTNRRAFSLLELMIVLTIMVAISAVAWPSLRRPMADSSVQQAANLLRDEIATCRQLAQVSGQPRLMRFDAGQSIVNWGSWTELIAEQLCDEGTESLVAEEDATNKLTKWELPIDIVVEEVQLDRTRYLDSTDTSTNGLTESSVPLQTQSSLQSDSLDETTARWYVPFLSNGQTRDAVIVLRDSVTGSRIALELDAITGMMRTSRLTTVEPEQAVENSASEPPGDLSEDTVTTEFDLEPRP